MVFLVVPNIGVSSIVCDPLKPCLGQLQRLFSEDVAQRYSQFFENVTPSRYPVEVKRELLPIAMRAKGLKTKNSRQHSEEEFISIRMLKWNNFAQFAGLCSDFVRFDSTVETSIKTKCSESVGFCKVCRQVCMESRWMRKLVKVNNTFIAAFEFRESSPYYGYRILVDYNEPYHVFFTKSLIISPEQNYAFCKKWHCFASIDFLVNEMGCNLDDCLEPLLEDNLSGMCVYLKNMAVSISYSSHQHYREGTGLYPVIQRLHVEKVIDIFESFSTSISSAPQISDCNVLPCFFKVKLKKPRSQLKSSCWKCSLIPDNDLPLEYLIFVPVTYNKPQPSLEKWFSHLAADNVEVNSSFILDIGDHYDGQFKMISFPYGNSDLSITSVDYFSKFPDCLRLRVLHSIAFEKFQNRCSYNERFFEKLFNKINNCLIYFRSSLSNENGREDSGSPDFIAIKMLEHANFIRSSILKKLLSNYYLSYDEVKVFIEFIQSLSHVWIRLHRHSHRINKKTLKAVLSTIKPLLQILTPRLMQQHTFVLAVEEEELSSEESNLSFSTVLDFLSNIFRDFSHQKFPLPWSRNVHVVLKEQARGAAPWHEILSPLFCKEWKCANVSFVFDASAAMEEVSFKITPDLEDNLHFHANQILTRRIRRSSICALKKLLRVEHLSREILSRLILGVRLISIPDPSISLDRHQLLPMILDYTSNSSSFRVAERKLSLVYQGRKISFLLEVYRQPLDFRGEMLHMNNDSLCQSLYINTENHHKI